MRDGGQRTRERGRARRLRRREESVSLMGLLTPAAIKMPFGGHVAV